MFETVIQKLNRVNEWFDVNRFSPNTGKTKCILFHKQQAHGNITLKLPTITLNNFEIKRRDFNEVFWSNHA